MRAERTLETVRIGIILNSAVGGTVSKELRSCGGHVGEILVAGGHLIFELRRSCADPFGDAGVSVSQLIGPAALYRDL